MKYVILLALVCAAQLVASAQGVQALDEDTRTRLAISQEARAIRFQKVFPGGVEYIEGTNGFLINLPPEHQSLFPRLSILEKERLLVAFYLAEEPALSHAQNIVVAARISAAKSLHAEEEGSIDQLAGIREEIPHREVLEDYFRFCLNVNDIAKRMVLVTNVFSHVSERFPELSKQDRWFLRAHLFCMPWDKHDRFNPLEDFAKENSQLDVHMERGLADFKAYLVAHAKEATRVFLS